MRGSATDSVGCVLRGSVVFTLFNEMKVKSIYGRFIGKANLCGNDNVSWREYVFLDKEVRFLPAEEGPYDLKPNHYRYNFEVALEGSLPESVTLPNGKIEYKMLAVVERTGLHFDIKNKRTVKLQRSSGCSYDSLFCHNIESSGVWDERFRYHMEIPQPSVTIGQSFPLSLDLTSLSKDFEMTKIDFTLRETICCGTHENPIDLRTKTHHLLELKGDEITGDGEEWKLCPQLVLFPGVQCTLDTDYIQIHHDIIVLFHIIDHRSGEKRVLEYEVPVSVRSCLQQCLEMSPPEYGNIPPTPCTMILGSPPAYTPSVIRT
ncbi:hypothetical protein K493DRAFT_313658 [Basidiobolus meristosporus CBS 931.73]|uniref:Arrestin C-terminal-like domain-containing protein n=1 Tax=Basidiobolus meristosporus CBS 931.73 TaxID=1314790 RepID=A0A1Y1YKQ9_9FUNG|nr:hypothetical protein K493DRAFT_313658 [Basidiobolus meristosporus CBS 931.73]|eukprot:ORX98413.1 hypothetical protein K493DRAFT_313658 [Basidiobolus meristosporus CBS 931.73]